MANKEVQIGIYEGNKVGMQAILNLMDERGVFTGPYYAIRKESDRKIGITWGSPEKEHPFTIITNIIHLEETLRTLGWELIMTATERQLINEFKKRYNVKIKVMEEEEEETEDEEYEY